MRDIVLTVDLEPDCPPFLKGWRGMREGAPRLLDLLAEEGVPATFFTTSEAAEAAPAAVERLVDEGHELGCHGRTHRAFPELTRDDAEEEIQTSAAVLRTFAPVRSFRAPYLRFPEGWLPLLEKEDFELDASRSRYKPMHWRAGSAASGLARLEASATSSVLRLPAALRDPWLRSLASPVVLFVHPWEFVDLTGEPIRWDCRFGTGEPALRSLREVVRLFKRRGARFLRADAAVAAGLARRYDRPGEARA